MLVYNGDFSNEDVIMLKKIKVFLMCNKVYNVYKFFQDISIVLKGDVLMDGVVFNINVVWKDGMQFNFFFFFGNYFVDGIVLQMWF